MRGLEVLTDECPESSAEEGLYRVLPTEDCLYRILDGKDRSGLLDEAGELEGGRPQGESLLRPVDRSGGQRGLDEVCDEALCRVGRRISQVRHGGREAALSRRIARGRP